MARYFVLLGLAAVAAVALAQDDRQPVSRGSFSVDSGTTDDNDVFPWHRGPPYGGWWHRGGPGRYGFHGGWHGPRGGWRGPRGGWHGPHGGWHGPHGRWHGPHWGWHHGPGYPGSQTGRSGLYRQLPGYMQAAMGLDPAVRTEGDTSPSSQQQRLIDSQRAFRGRGPWGPGPWGQGPGPWGQGPGPWGGPWRGPWNGPWDEGQDGDSDSRNAGDTDQGNDVENQKLRFGTLADQPAGYQGNGRSGNHGRRNHRRRNDGNGQTRNMARQGLQGNQRESGRGPRYSAA